MSSKRLFGRGRRNRNPRRLGEHRPKLPEAPLRAANLPALVRRDRRVDVGEDEIFMMPAAADDDFAERVDDVAVAVTDAFIVLDAAVQTVVDVVAADEIDAILNRTG